MSETLSRNELALHLGDISNIIPYLSGLIQNKDYERKLPKLFEYDTYDQLIKAISLNINRGIIPDNENIKNYYINRWYMNKCASVDNMFFNEVAGKNKYSLDLSGIVAVNPKEDNINQLLNNPLLFIDKLYRQESKYFSYQKSLRNRLFLAHYSFIDNSRIPFLQSLFTAKQVVINKYITDVLLNDKKIFDYYNNRKSDIIFLIERADNTIEYGFGSDKVTNAIKFNKLPLITQ